MAKIIKNIITKGAKKPSKASFKKTTMIEPADWYAKAKASIGISKTNEPLLPPRSR